MSEPRIGVVGAGVFGGHHAAKYVELPDCVLVGVFDPLTDRAAALAARLDARGAIAAFDRIEALFEACDAVVVAAPASAHFKIARAALEFGLHVFVEKPLATNRRDGETLARLAAESGRILQVGHQERYVCDEIGLFARRMRPTRIECVRRVPATGRCEDVSAVLDLMVHDIDIVRRLVDLEIEDLHCSGDREDVDASVRLRGGVDVVFRASRRASEPERRMILTYPDGVIDVDFLRRAVRDATPAQRMRALDPVDAPLALRDPLAFGADLFIRAIVSGEPKGVDGADAARVLDWADAIEAALHARAGAADGARPRPLEAQA